MAILLLICLSLVIVLVIVINRFSEISNRLRSLEETVFQITRELREVQQPAAPTVPTATPNAVAKGVHHVVAEPPPVSAPASARESAPPVQEVQPPAPLFVPPPLPPSRTREEWEALIGGKLLNRIGALALVIGVGFFLKYAFDNNWLSETVRVLIGAVAGILLLAGAARSRKKGLLIFAQGLVGAGIAVLYLSVYASFNYYHLVSQPVAFVLMAAVTVIAFTQAFLYDSIAVSLLGWAGGFLTPFMLSTGEPNEIGLFSYVALLAAGLLVVVMKKDRWAILEPLTIGATYCMYFLWFDQEYQAASFVPTLFFAILFWALFFVVDMVNSLRRVEALEDVRRVAAGFNAALFLLALVLLINPDHQTWMGETTLVLGLAYAGAALVVRRASTDLYVDFARLMCTSIILLIVAPAIEFERFTIIMYWAVEALLLAWAGRRWNLGFAATFGFVLYVLTVGALLMTRGALVEPFPQTQMLLFNMRGAAFLLLAASLGLGGIIFAKQPVAARSGTPRKLSAGTASLLQYGWCFLLFVLVTVETNDHFRSLIITATGSDIQALSFQRYMTLAVVWALLAVVLVWIARLRNLIPALYSGIVVIFFAMAMAAVRGTAYVPIARFDLLVNYRNVTILLVIAGAFAMAAMLWKTRHIEWIEEWGDALRISIVVLILVLLTGETRDFFEKRLFLLDSAGSNSAASATALENLKQLSLSGIWLLYSISLMGIGIWRRIRSLRIMAIVLFGLTILKIFIYDLSFLETLYRIFSFIGLGVVLLLVSYLYQHYKEVIFHERPKEEQTEETTTQ